MLVAELKDRGCCRNNSQSVLYMSGATTSKHVGFLRLLCSSVVSLAFKHVSRQLRGVSELVFHAETL